MATTTQHCKTCGRTLIKIPRSQYEMCPACQTVNLFNSKLKDCILTRLGQYVNAGTSQNQDALQGQPPQTKTSSQQTVPPAAVKVDRSYRILRPQLSRLTLSRIHQQTPQVHGKKRAVLCGVTYNGHKKKLEASVHNVRSMQQLLQNKLGFPSASIRVLTEEESDPSRIPTKCNIEEALRWLVQGCQSGDSLMFYYAGHGCKVVDEDGDETDGYDEALCPVDYREAGKIIDDEINATIVAPLPHGVTLHSVIDTCFSGTLLDLPFLCNINQNVMPFILPSRDGLYMWEEHQLTNKGTSGGKALCISACADDQNSADTSAFTGNAEPQLSCSTRFEIYSEPVML
ncbi:Peptidase C14, caspase catalytic [Cynara cardunculus var. scolymus]|uniref:Peptidase C14, caspase catalytic n=1 Tax=Cynara cardunculus var. scolymus TaxID=59895 RepID=A0A103S3Y5_CYNCS|nr:Peptidase C14, caspase catalytic [Cynara cardunculus var. scolymus]